MIRGETRNRALKRAFRENGETPLTLGFDSDDLGTFSPIGKNGGYLSSLRGEQIWPLPLDCEWEEIPPACKAHIMPTLEVLIVYFTSILIVINRLDMCAIFKLFVYSTAYVCL